MRSLWHVLADLSNTRKRCQRMYTLLKNMYLKKNLLRPRLFLPLGLKSRVTRTGRKLHPWGGKKLRVKCTTALPGCAGCSGAVAGLAKGRLPQCFPARGACEHLWLSHCWAKTLPSDAAGLNHFVSLCSIEVILPVTSLGSTNLL